MEKEKLIGEIIKKREFSQISKKDIEIAISHYNKNKKNSKEIIKQTRALLHKAFGSFGSKKIFSAKNKDFKWYLNKHLSTRDRLPFYEDIYRRVLAGLNKKLSIFDLGSGINGFSYPYFKKVGFEVEYYAIESVGQFVEIMNNYFFKNKMKGKALHLSLFEKDTVIEVIKKGKYKPKIVFLFKIIDSLERLKTDYSKELILDVSKLCDRFILSFPLHSLSRKKKFKTSRSWILNFINSHFKVLDDFEVGWERFIVFTKPYQRTFIGL